MTKINEQFVADLKMLMSTFAVSNYSVLICVHRNLNGDVNKYPEWDIVTKQGTDLNLYEIFTKVLLSLK